MLSTAYDRDGNVLSQTDGRTKTTTYGYDALYHLTSSQDTKLQTTTYGRDLVGNLTSITYPGSTSPNVSMVYDVADQPASVSYDFPDVDQMRLQEDTGSMTQDS
jgi:YD repeat-containing protein